MSVLAVLKEWVTGEVNASGVEVVDYDLEGGSGSGGRRRGALYRLPSSRGKSIFTIICKHKEDAHKAAQYLKSGSAVFVNLQSIDRSKGQRIVDVLSGVKVVDWAAALHSLSQGATFRQMEGVKLLTMTRREVPRCRSG